MHIPIYDEKLSLLKDRILHDDSKHQSYIVAGQAGSGKTTALKFMEDGDLNQDFQILYLSCNKYLDIYDVDIIDLMLIIAFSIVENTHLEDAYFQKLQQFQKHHLGVLSEETLHENKRRADAAVSSEAQAKAGFFDILSLKSRFFARYRLDDLHRKRTREIFQPRKIELLDLINGIIEQYVAEVSHGKPILLVVDDLDKVRDIPQINELFLKNRHLIANIMCKKIICVSAHLATQAEIDWLDPYVTNIGITLGRNPRGMGAGIEDIQARRQMMINVIRARIDARHDLIEDEVIEKALDASGGLIRQFITLLQGAAMIARVKKQGIVTLENLKFSLNQRKNIMERELIAAPARIHFLSKILEDPFQVPDAPDCPDALLKNQIIAQENGTVWFIVNPLLVDAVKKYGANQASD